MRTRSCQGTFLSHLRLCSSEQGKSFFGAPHKTLCCVFWYTEIHYKTTASKGAPTRTKGCTNEGGIPTWDDFNTYSDNDGPAYCLENLQSSLNFYEENHKKQPDALLPCKALYKGPLSPAYSYRRPTNSCSALVKCLPYTAASSWPADAS